MAAPSELGHLIEAPSPRPPARSFNSLRRDSVHPSPRRLPRSAKTAGCTSKSELLREQGFRRSRVRTGLSLLYRRCSDLAVGLAGSFLSVSVLHERGNAHGG